MARIEYYLQRELYDLIKKDDSIFEFIQGGSLDGLWYWDLENPENEWMSPRFWEALGYNPEKRKHLASEWQDIIFEEDLSLAIINFTKHCEDPSHPYDQVVRYRHKNDSTVWVRCRGIAIRDEKGKPIRMLGAHIDITQQKLAEAESKHNNIQLEQRNKELEEVLGRLEKNEKLLLSTVDKLENTLAESSSSMKMLHKEVRKRTSAENQAQRANELLQCLGLLREQFITESDPFVLFSQFLETLLELTKSEFGLVGDVLSDIGGKAYLKIYAISNLSWNDETIKLYNEQRKKGLEFRKLDNLFGLVVTSGQPVISNNPASDSRRGGFPKGHPEITSFIGIPVYFGDKLVGEVGLANRPGGYDQEFLDRISPVTAGLGQIIAARWDREERKNAENQLIELATTDSLTGALNRREFNRILGGIITSSSRYPEEVTLLMLDIDHFKSINDAYGHDVGDRVIITLVQQVLSVIREVDTLARWGGEEFMVLFPKTNKEEGVILAERLRQHVEKYEFISQQQTTISLGLASLQEGDTVKSIVKRADNALYQAKKDGRNRVIAG